MIECEYALPRTQLRQHANSLLGDIFRNIASVTAALFLQFVKIVR